MSCSMGIALNQRCSAEPPAEYLLAETLPERTLLLLKLRSGMTTDITTVCQTHHRKYWRVFIPHNCCDPQGNHPTKVRRNGLWTITAGFHDEFHRLCPRVVQGMKLCITCKIRIQTELSRGRPKKRKFSLDQKLAMLDRLAAGETVEGLAAEHDTTTVVIQSIVRKEWQIRREVAQAAEVRTELLTAERELRHRFNAGGAFKMEKFGHRNTVEEMSCGQGFGFVGDFDQSRKRARKVKTDVRVKGEDGKLDQFLVEEMQQEVDETVMLSECGVEVKIEIVEDTVDVENE